MPTAPGHRSHRVVVVAGVALALALTSTLAACGKDDPAPSSSIGSPTTQGGNAAPSTGEAAGPFDWTGDPSRDGSLRSAKVRLLQVAELQEPTVLLPRPEDKRLYAAERAGRVRMLRRSGDRLTVVDRPVLDISGDTTTEAERGLLGLAFSADGATLYISHTNRRGDSRVEAYRMRSDGTADARSKRVLIAQEQPFPNHNGGNIVLGPDGYLYFGLGDGGLADDPQNRAQNPKELLGKVLRIDPRGAHGDTPYAIPAGNPYRKGGGRPEIFLSGVRNPWRFSFDRATGDLWIGDVGQNAVEEVDHLPKGAGAGRNLGWSGYEGSVSYREGDGRRPARSVPPVFEYRHDDGGCSITGGFVYRGTRIRTLAGAYVFADYCAGQLRALRLGKDAKVADERLLGAEVAQPISFAQDADGELYVLSQQGPISRLVPA